MRPLNPSDFYVNDFYSVPPLGRSTASRSVVALWAGNWVGAGTVRECIGMYFTILRVASEDRWFGVLAKSFWAYYLDVVKQLFYECEFPR